MDDDLKQAVDKASPLVMMATPVCSTISLTVFFCVIFQRACTTDINEDNKRRTQKNKGERHNTNEENGINEKRKSSKRTKNEDKQDKTRTTKKERKQIVTRGKGRT